MAKTVSQRAFVPRNDQRSSRGMAAVIALGIFALGAALFGKAPSPEAAMSMDASEVRAGSGPAGAQSPAPADDNYPDSFVHSAPLAKDSKPEL